ncbi:MAG: aldehyde dehydrogenase family protein [Candidatus Omnitrophota bacterium]
MQEYKYYIGGEFRKSKQTIEVVNSATEESFAHIFEATQLDLDDAVKYAKGAQKQWRAQPYKERAKILREISRIILDNLSALAEIESKEIGKPLKESLFVDIPLAAQCFDYYASFLEILENEIIQVEGGVSSISYDPYGVCAVYLPYNVPLMIFGFCCAAALAAGNSLIVKPSEYGSLSLLELVKHLDKLDIPKGLINIVTGPGPTVGKWLAESEADLISFTGSRDTLKKIFSQTAQSPKKIICELGGCNITAIFSDADIKSALENILASAFMKQGQICIGTSAALIQEDIYEVFVKELIQKAEMIKVGDPFDPSIGMGSLVTKEHLLNIDKKVKNITKMGGKVLTGGKILKKKGYFYPPTVIAINEMVYEEFFAPVILIRRFRDEDEIEKVLEDNPTGLVAQIWTSNLKRADSLAKKAHCGTVWINTFVQMTPQIPFGGMQQSGWGRNLGRFGFFEYVQPKHIGIGHKKSPVEGWFGL